VRVGILRVVPSPEGEGSCNVLGCDQSGFAVEIGGVSGPNAQVTCVRFCAPHLRVLGELIRQALR
jgi:hypothetical protein